MSHRPMLLLLDSKRSCFPRLFNKLIFVLIFVARCSFLKQTRVKSVILTYDTFADQMQLGMNWFYPTFKEMMGFNFSCARF